MQSVKLFLSRHGLLTQEKSLETNQPLSCKTVSSVNGDTKSPQQIVELWPLFEYIGTIREINAVVRLLEQGSMDPEVVVPLTDYKLMFTPASPVDIYHYQQMAACTTQVIIVNRVQIMNLFVKVFKSKVKWRSQSHIQNILLFETLLLRVFVSWDNYFSFHRAVLVSNLKEFQQCLDQIMTSHNPWYSKT